MELNGLLLLKQAYSKVIPRAVSILYCCLMAEWRDPRKHVVWHGKHTKTRHNHWDGGNLFGRIILIISSQSSNVMFNSHVTTLNQSTHIYWKCTKIEHFWNKIQLALCEFIGLCNPLILSCFVPGTFGRSCYKQWLFTIDNTLVMEALSYRMKVKNALK